MSKTIYAEQRRAFSDIRSTILSTVDKGEKINLAKLLLDVQINYAVSRASVEKFIYNFVEVTEGITFDREIKPGYIMKGNRIPHWYELIEDEFEREMAKDAFDQGMSESEYAMHKSVKQRLAKEKEAEYATKTMGQNDMPSLETSRDREDSRSGEGESDNVPGRE